MVSPDPLSPLRCPRCVRSLDYLGTKAFPAGTLSQLADVLTDDALEVYLCPECGRVELFATSVGEEFRKDL
jgi:hypothetical protein